MRVLFVTKKFDVEPLGIMYLSAVLQKDGHQVDIATDEDVFAEMERFKPHIVAFSVMTGDQNFFVSLNREVKENFNVVSIMGGPHPTFFPEVIEEPGLDMICIGEGEGAMVDLANRMERGETVKDIKNLWIKQDGNIYKNEIRPFISDLDTIPFPDRKFTSKYQKGRKWPVSYFIGTRGCPYKCTYCFNHVYHKMYKGKGKMVRYRSIGNLITEIKGVVRDHATRLVYFQDDTFTLNKNWLREFCESYKREIKLPFHCHLRPNVVDEEVVSWLKEANCYSVHMAVETADDYLRNHVLKRNMSIEEIDKAAALLHKYKIKFMLQNLVGLPGGSLEKDMETLRLNIRLKPEFVMASILQPYPKTEIAEYSQKLGLYDGNFEDIQRTFSHSSVLKIKNKGEVYNLQKWFPLTVRFPFILRSGLLGFLIRVPTLAPVKLLYRGISATYWKGVRKKMYQIK